MSNDSTPTKKVPSELNVGETIVALWRKKWLILFVTSVPLALSCIYVFTRPPLYEVSAKVISVPESNLVSYNTAVKSASDATAGILTRASLANIPPLSPAEALSHLIGRMKAHAMDGLKFDRSIPTPRDGAESNGLRFEGTVQADISGGSVPFSIITFRSTQPAQLTQRANRYLERMIEASKQELLENLQAEITLRINDMESYHEVMKTVAIEETKSRAIRVQEALTMAEDIGLENPPLGGPYFLFTEHLSNHSVLTNDNLMYLRGASALRAELTRLEKRLNIDPHIFMLPYMNRKTEQLKIIELKPELFNVAYIDGYALEPSRHFKITNLFILLFAGLSGFLAAILLAAVLGNRDKS